MPQLPAEGLISHFPPLGVSTQWPWEPRTNWGSRASGPLFQILIKISFPEDTNIYGLISFGSWACELELICMTNSCKEFTKRICFNCHQPKGSFKSVTWLQYLSHPITKLLWGWFFPLMMEAWRTGEGKWSGCPTQGATQRDKWGFREMHV
jgi:hypothetical protein